MPRAEPRRHRWSPNSVFGASSVHAADRVRCRQTVALLADDIGSPIVMEPSLTEEAYAADPRTAHDRVLAIAALGGTPVICTQGKVIPFLIDWWCERDGSSPTSPATARSTGAVTGR